MTEEGGPCSRHHTSALSADWAGCRGQASGDMKRVVPAPETCGQPSCILSEALGREGEGASESEARFRASWCLLAHRGPLGRAAYHSSLSLKGVLVFIGVHMELEASAWLSRALHLG